MLGIVAASGGLTLDTVYIVVPALLVAVVLAAVWLERWSVPVILVALATGILFGSDVLKLWTFGDVVLTNRVANLALVFILFQGGFSTRREDLRAVALPSLGLATWGVVLTAAATLGLLWLVLDWAFEKAMLLAVIISSTDAAATISILSRRSVSHRLGSLVEIESATNDPMAIVLTMAAVQSLATGQGVGLGLLPTFLWKLGIGPLLGWLLARGTVWVYNRLAAEDRGYYYVLFLATLLLTYGLGELAGASGMLAVFTAGFVMGNRPFVHKRGVANFSAALSTIANIGMFLLMGVLVFPREWGHLWLDGIILFAVLTFVSRPVAVWLGTLGMPLRAKEKLFISWAGLRGAVPIILATYPAAAGLAVGQDVLNLTFFAVILSVATQGSTLATVARWLGLSAPTRPRPLYTLELLTMAHSDLDLVVVDLPGPPGIQGPRIRELSLPKEAVIAMITRGRKVVSPNGSTRLRGWDNVTVLAHARDQDVVRRALLEPFSRDGSRAGKGKGGRRSTPPSQ